MIDFPNAKINLALFVSEKRNDGFHNIETIFYPIPLYDILEFVPINKGKTEFIQTGIKIDSLPEENLVIKAYKLIKKQFELPPIKIHLHKIIPFGAGLGGGSSDAAFMLKMLNKYFKLNISCTELERKAAELGSDCAFFIKNKAVCAYGKGDKFEETTVNLKDKFLYLVKPRVFISTEEAYSGIKPNNKREKLSELSKSEYFFEKYAVNDFEKPIFEKFPELRKIKNQMYNAGAEYAAMTGSGSAIFGIFEFKPEKITKFDNLFQKILSL